MRCVKIYLCSNPDDSVVERRALRDRVFPRLREYCRQKYGVDFTVTDPYEGMRPHHWPSHQERSQLLQECRESSAGPFFVGLVGEHYGAACLPEQVEVSEFQQILQVCRQMQLSTEVLERCYRRDENTVPASYCLLKPADYVTLNNSKGEERAEVHWHETVQEATETVCGVVMQCVREGNLTSVEAQKYLRSGLDKELHLALGGSSSSDLSRCLCYVHRIITTKRSQRKVQNEARSDLQEQSKKLLTELRDHFLPGLVTSSHPLVYTTMTECDQWRGYTTDMRQHYTEALCQQLHSDLRCLIDSTVTRITNHANDSFTQHRDLSATYSRLYRIERAEVECVKAYLEQTDTRQPLVLISGPCSGKSVLLAHCASQVRAWLKDTKLFVIPHFANLNISLKDFIRNLYYQVVLLCTQTCNRCSHNNSPLREGLSNLLVSVSSFKHPLILFIDGLDQLPNTDRPLDMTWLPESLPPTLKIVISTSPSKSGVLLALKKQYPEHHYFVEMRPIESKSCIQMLTTLLETSQRKITSGQQMYVNQTFQKCSLPLCVDLLHLQVCVWTSESEVTENTLAQGVHANICGLLDHLEEIHGKALVTRTMGYLTLSRYGMTAAELTDVLSCDDEVLARFLSSESPAPSSLRVPEVVVERLLLDLKKFLIMRKIFGFQSLFWVSRHFPLVIRKRYLWSIELIKEMHHALADYFSGCWTCGKAKSLFICDTETPDTETHKTSDSPDVIPSKIYIDRLSPSQPWIFHYKSPVSMYSPVPDSAQGNLRKVLELPFHLREADRLEELGREVMMSYVYHLAMLENKLLEELVAWLKETSHFVFSRELLFLCAILENSACLLNDYPDALTLVMQAKLIPFLQVFPELKEYTNQVLSDRRNTVNAVVCPAPAVPSTFWALPEARRSPITHAAEAHGTIAVILSDGSVWAWNGCDSEGFKLPQSPEIQSTSISGSGNLFLMSTQNHKLLLWDINVQSNCEDIQFHRSRELQCTTYAVEGVLVSNDKLFVWWKGRNHVSVFDRRRKVEITQLQCFQDITCVSCSSDGQYVYCGQGKSTVSIFEPCGHNIATFTCSTGAPIINVTLCEGEENMTCVDSTGSVFVWDVEIVTEPKLVKDFSSQGQVLTTDLSKENNILLICKKQEVLLWDTCMADVGDQFKAPKGKTFIQAVLDRSSHFILALLDECPVILVWKWSTGQCVLSLDAGNTRITRLLKLGTTHLAAVTPTKVILWDKDLITEAATSPKSGVKVTKVVVESNGEHFYTTDNTELVCKWGRLSGNMEGQFQHLGPIDTMALSPDSEHLVTIASGDIYVWKTDTGKNLHRICDSQAYHILITPKSNFAVSLSQRGPSRVWKLGNGHVVCSIHYYLCNPVISPESTFLLGLHSGDLLAVSLWSGFVSKRFSCYNRSKVLAFHPLVNSPDYILVITKTGLLYSWKLTDETICQQFQMPKFLLCQPEVFQVSSDGSYAILSIKGTILSILDVTHGKLCSLKTEGCVLQAYLDHSGQYALCICNASVENLGCPCDLHAKPVLIAVRVSDGKKIGRFYLCKHPTVMCLSEDLCVYVGFEDGSVGIYSVDAEKNSINAKDHQNNVDTAMLCKFAKPLKWPPLPEPNITWMDL
ncbi:NACHT and WD repeat domain-containing protein 2 [Chanos chanos]|uniref:NACHT and WD repeat domain-containing protein 2 n=1 Tax=Chanos chanos TaxID=29144 RepID=A0A6J2UM39_CHACN|nr:NACHT and WD repeat domain-containing protein 2-like [Chanos chanos]